MAFLNGRASDGCGSRAGVKANQDKAGEMAKRTPAGIDLLAFPGASVNGLSFLGAPAYAQEVCGFLSSQPAISRSAFGREYDPNDASMIAFLGMMVHRGSQILQVTPCTTIAAAPASVLPARLAIDVGKLLSTPKSVEALQSSKQLFSVVTLVIDLAVVDVDRDDVSDIDVLDIQPASAGLVLCRYIRCELAFRLCNFARSASCGDLSVAVEDEPHGLTGFVSSRWS